MNTDKAIILKDILVERVVGVPEEKRARNKRVIRLNQTEAEKVEKIIRKERASMRKWHTWTNNLKETVPFARLPDGGGRLVVRSTENHEHKRKLPENWADESVGFRADMKIVIKGYINEKSKGIRCHLLSYERKEDGKTC